MTTDKEELRKEFVEELRKGITFAGQIGDYVINQSLFDWLNSKLEAKDKEIAELKIQLSAELYADSVARELQHDDLVMLKDLYNACCKYEKERQGLMSWEIPSLHRAKQILSRKYPDMTFDEDGRLIYRP